MKNIKSFKLLLLLLLIAGSSFGQTNKPSISVDASARIVSPLGLTKSGELNFGTLITTSVAATGGVVMDPNALSITGTSSILPDKIDGEKSSFPTFTVTGELGLEYNITIPKVNVAIILNDDDGDQIVATIGAPYDATNRMFISDFTYSINGEANVTGTDSENTDQIIGTIERGENDGVDSDGDDINLNANKNTFVVGGTLTVNASQIKGSYTGTYDVTVEYK